MKFVICKDTTKWHKDDIIELFEFSNTYSIQISVSSKQKYKAGARPPRGQLSIYIYL